LQQGHQLLCLRPEEWQKKQEAAIQQEHIEAAQVLAEARAKDQSVVDVAELPNTAYRQVSIGAPEGCDERCPCRSKALLHGALVPVCMDMGRFKKLEREQNKRRKDALRARLNALVKEAHEVINQEKESGRWQRVALTVSYPLLMTAGKPVVQQAAKEMAIFLDFEKLFSYQTADREKMKLLAELDSGKLLAFAARVLVAKEAKEALEWQRGSTLYADTLLNRLNPPQQELATANDTAEAVAQETSGQEPLVGHDHDAGSPEFEAEASGAISPGTEADRRWTAGDSEEADWFADGSPEQDPFSDEIAEPNEDEEPDDANWEDPWNAEEVEGSEAYLQDGTGTETFAEAPMAADSVHEDSDEVTPSHDVTTETVA
jgi:hypothetical protein